MWAWSLALLVAATVAVEHDGWTPSVAGCSGRDSLEKAEACEGLSRRRNSKDAAIASATALIIANNYPRAREVLAPFAASGDPAVLYRLAWLDASAENHALALSEYAQAFAAARRLTDLQVVARVTINYAYELYEAAQYEEAVRILDALLRAHSGALALADERAARLRLARALTYLGDGPAAEAELRRLRAILGPTPPSTLELLLDAELHLDGNQLHSADELLLKAEAAARREGILRYQATAVMNRIEVAAKEADWKRVHALSVQARAFGEVLQPGDRRDLTFLEGIAARAEGRLTESRSLLEQALALSPPPSRLWEVKSELGLTLGALGQVGEAKKVLEESLAQLEAQRQQLGEARLQAAALGSREKPYQALFELLAEAGDARGALGVLQQSLASRLGEEVAEASSNAGHEVADALNRRVATEGLEQASRELPERQPAGVREARFLALVTTETHSWALVQGASGGQLVRVALLPEALCALMQKFGEGLDEEAGVQLGAALFPPATLAALGPRFAVILPHCARSFPVAAVRVGEGRLVDRAVVSVAPDVSTVSFRQKGEATRSGLVLADPLGDLPAARQEAQWTEGFTRAEGRHGAAATQAALEGPSAQVLHFATHTVVDVAGPSLVLSDRNLTVADILRRRLHAELVVLASCHSGSRLEATAGDTLSTAFLRAGSGAVLATLRSVEDSFAAQVVRAFYTQGGRDDPAGALATVQRRLAQTEPPARWSAFFVAGSPQALRHPAQDGRVQALGL